MASYPKNSISESPLFFIDTEGDNKEKLDTKGPNIISLMENANLLYKDPLAIRESQTMNNTPSLLKVNVISNDFPRDSDLEDEDETEEDDEIFYLGRNKPLRSGSFEDSDDEDSEVSDYIRNAAENGDDYMTDDLARMKLEGDDSLDDDDFADLAAGSFLCRSPSTFMESSLDMDAVHFLNKIKRAGKQKRSKGKGHLEKKKGSKPVEFDGNFDPFRYDGPYTIGAINFKQINRELKMFINDDVEDELEMDPMPPLPRKFLHELAHMYGLKSKSSGQGRDRHCVLFKTERSGLPRNVKQVSDLIQKADKAIMWMDKTVTKGQKFTAAAVSSKVKEGRKGKKGGSNKSSPGLSAKPEVGSVVGQDAAPLDESNLGNKMLRKLGWKPGEGLGTSNEGMVDPLTAVVRGKRTGLGA